MRVALLALAALLLALEADARVGGGQSFSSGSSRGGGGGGGGGGEAEIIYLLIRLVIYYPQVGVPVAVVCVVGFAVRSRMNATDQPRQVHTTHRQQTARPRRRTDLERLAEQDQGFSEPVLVDFIQLIHRRALKAAVSGVDAFSPLAPFVAPVAQKALTDSLAGAIDVSEVVLASTRISQVDLSSRFRLTVELAGSRLEHSESGEKRVYVEETWVFTRDAGTASLPPDKVMALGCPNCGAAIETDDMGQCRACDTPITHGQLQWQAVSVSIRLRRPVTAPEVGLLLGGDERSYTEPTLIDSHLDARLRAFSARHPEFDKPAFDRRVKHIFDHLQRSWSDGKWEGSRPHVTDSLFQSLRFWIDGYKRAGLRNRLDDVKLLRAQIVHVGLDAWYESITLRLWGSMKDSVIDANGKVVGGNAKVDRRFSEYWTFLRTAGTPITAHDNDHCPNCGAPLDNVNAAGVCQYCDTKIISGDFDWVLSRIDQAETYGR